MAERESLRESFGYITVPQLEASIKRWFAGIEQRIDSSTYTILDRYEERNLTREDLHRFNSIEPRNTELDLPNWKYFLPTGLVEVRLAAEGQSVLHWEQAKEAVDRAITRIPADASLGRYLEFKCQKGESSSAYREQRTTLLLYDLEPVQVARSIVDAQYRMELIGFLPRRWPQEPSRVLKGLVRKIKEVEGRVVPSHLFQDV